MSMVKDQRTAERVVRDYCRGNGFTMGDRERDLVDAIAGELARARREEARPPLQLARGRR